MLNNRVIKTNLVASEAVAVTEGVIENESEKIAIRSVKTV